MMNIEEIREYYEHQVEWYRHQVEWYTKQIGRESKELERYRKADRELVEYVWSKGPVEEIDIRIYGKNGRGYKGEDTKKCLATRKKYYTRRKRMLRSLQEFEQKLAKEV